MSAVVAIPQSRGTMVAAAIGAASVVHYLLLKYHLLPSSVMHMWFAFSAATLVLSTSALTALIDPLRYLGVSSYYTQRVCVVVLSLAFKLTWYVNPQIKMSLRFDGNGPDGKPKSFKDLPKKNVAFVMNHTSFWDIFQYIAQSPFSVLINTRTLMKDALRKIPIFGGIFDRVGHFPVFFNSDEDGNFHVDKEKQAKVQVKVDEHIAQGGNLAIFPEGAVNKNSAVIQNFRFGTFSTICQHRMKVCYMVSLGNEDSWPRTAGFGGYPADIRVRLGMYEIDYDKSDSKKLAGDMQALVQRIHDELREEREKEYAAKGKKIPGAPRVKAAPVPPAVPAPAAAS